MQVAFVLSMPGNNSWNGKWSGASNLYAVVKTIHGAKAQKKWTDQLALKGEFGYDFGDGWYANVSVGIVTPDKARQLRRDTKGFNGYEWMIESIERYGKIIASHQTEKIEEAEKELATA